MYSFRTKKPYTKSAGQKHPSNSLLFHPDYTVGIGIAPIQLQMQVADYTASGESHPALKNYMYRIQRFIKNARDERKYILLLVYKIKTKNGRIMNDSFLNKKVRNRDE